MKIRGLLWNQSTVFHKMKIGVFSSDSDFSICTLQIQAVTLPGVGWVMFSGKILKKKERREKKWKRDQKG